MDTGEYDTNAIVLNNIKSISFRFYEIICPDASLSVQHLTEVDIAAKTDKYIVFADHRRRGLWTFSFVTTNAPTPFVPTKPTEDDHVVIYNRRFALRDEGSLEPADLGGNSVSGHVSAKTSSAMSSMSALFESSGSTIRRAASSSLLSQTVQIAHPGKESKTNQWAAKDTNTTYQYCIAALIRMATWMFAKRTGSIPLDDYTLLLPSRCSLAHCPSERWAQATAIATCRAYVTTAGSMIISMSIKQLEGLLPLSELGSEGHGYQNMPLVIAPLGLFGNVGFCCETGTPAQESAQSRSPTRQASLDFQCQQGVHLGTKLSFFSPHAGLFPNPELPLKHSHGDAMTLVESISSLALTRQDEESQQPREALRKGLVWPTRFCFAQRPAATSHTTSGEAERLPCNIENSMDPLASVGDWMALMKSRPDSPAQQLHKVKCSPRLVIRDRGDASRGLPQRQLVASTRLLQPRSLKQPGSNRRDMLLSSCFYPTPPDVVPSIANGISPSVEGAITSPYSTTNATNMIDGDASRQQVMAKPQGNSMSWVPQNQDRASHDSLFDASVGSLSVDGEDNHTATDADPNLPPVRSPHVFTAVVSGNVNTPPSSLAFHKALGGALHDSSHSHVSLKHHRPPGSHVDMAASETSCEQTTVVPTSSHAGYAAFGAVETKSAQRGVKRPPSPFNFHTVYKRVKAYATLTLPTKYQATKQPVYNRAAFGNVEFDPFLRMVDMKYTEGGAFACPKSMAKNKTSAAGGNATLMRHTKKRGRIKHLPSNLRRLVRDISASRAAHSSTSDFQATKGDESCSDFSDTLDSSDDDTSIVSAVNSKASSVKIMQSPEIEATALDPPSLPDGIGLDDSGRDSNVPEYDATAQLASIQAISQNSRSSVPISTFFSCPAPFNLQLSVEDDDFIDVAQFLNAQAATGPLLPTFFLPENGMQIMARPNRRWLALLTRRFSQAFYADLKTALAESSTCQLRSLTEVADEIPLVGQPSRVQATPTATCQTPGRNHSKKQVAGGPTRIFPISYPHLEVKRAGSRFALLPPAVPFWPSLGLGPRFGMKEISAVCVFPGLSGMLGSADIFLESMRVAYKSLHLGNFSRIAVSENNQPAGLLPFDAKSASTVVSDTMLRPPLAHKNSMAQLLQALVGSSTSPQNYVVFFVFLPHIARSVVEACISFQWLLETYKHELKQRSQKPTSELILQLVPANFLLSSTAWPVPLPSDYHRLALQTYDRCTFLHGSMPAPSITLEKTLPKSIDFKLSTTPSASIVDENSCIHLAYAQSTDERWVSAAWTDACGVLQYTTAYCRGRRGMVVSTPLVDVIQAMWHTTQKLVSSHNVHWRLYVAKCGSMSPIELARWQELASKKTGPTSLSLTVLTVDSDPALQLIPPATKVAPITCDLMGCPPTLDCTNEDLATFPSPVDPDPQATLINVADRSWGVILSHRLNTVPPCHVSCPELAPTHPMVSAARAGINTKSSSSSSSTPPTPSPVASLISGYLVKNGGPSPADPPFVLEVNVVHSEANARMYETLLKEVLKQFRALGSLARARGMGAGLSVASADHEDLLGARPWHVSAVERGVRGLSTFM